ncbi:Uma2 family endonuclease [soil metagenome]
MIADRFPGASPDDGVRRWKVGRDEFYRLADLGFFGEDRVEWLDGDIYMAPPPGGQHGTRTDELNLLLVQRLSDHFVVRNQNGLRCPRAELAPDFALVAKHEYRRNEVPTRATLVIEVSRSTLAYDLETKREHYAEAGVHQYWVIDLAHRQVIAFEDPVPADGRYGTMRTRVAGESLTVPTTEVTIEIDELLG